jgi:simple sugar transport system ATP-binding protein
LAIQRAIGELADAGAAIVVISQDLDEIMSLCDRIAIIAGGRLSAPLRPDETTRGEIGLLMGGITAAASDAA